MGRSAGSLRVCVGVWVCVWVALAWRSAQMLMIGDLFFGMLTGYLRSPLSFSLCSLEAPASAEGARILYYGSIRWIVTGVCWGVGLCLGSSCLAVCANADDRGFVPGNAYGISSLSALILALLLGSSSFRRRSPYPLLWVDPLDRYGCVLGCGFVFG